MDLFYRKYGEGKPLIILHGLFGMSDNWMTIGKRLAENNLCVYIPDQRNHGESPRSDEFSYDVLGSDLYDFIQQHALSSPSIIGHSMGGKAAMNYALRYSNTIDKLVIVDIGIRKYATMLDLTIDSLLSVEIENRLSRIDIETVLSDKIKSPKVRQLMMKNVKRTDDNHFDWKFNLAGIRNNFARMHDKLVSDQKYLKPVLFVRGEYSDYIKDDDLPGIMDLFPKAEFQTIQGAGHWVHADNPDEFLKLISDYIC